MKKSNHWLSMDENKKSIVVLLLIVAFIVGMWMTFKSGDIPPNLMTIIIAFAGTVGVVNVSAQISNRTSTQKTEYVVDDSDMDTNHYYTTNYESYEPQKEVNDRAPI